MDWTNIVVGVSQAPTSRVAARHAFALAELTGATVHVVTAVDRPEVTEVGSGSDTFRLSDLDDAEHDVESFVSSLGPTVPWRVVAIDSKPGAALIDVAERIGADLIVVGNVRMQGVGRVLGSVGNDVAHHAPCSVLIVKTV